MINEHSRGSCPYSGQLVVQLSKLSLKWGNDDSTMAPLDYSTNLILIRTFVIWHRITICPLVFGVSTGIVLCIN